MIISLSTTCVQTVKGEILNGMNSHSGGHGLTSPTCMVEEGEKSLKYSLNGDGDVPEVWLRCIPVASIGRK